MHRPLPDRRQFLGSAGTLLSTIAFQHSAHARSGRRVSANDRIQIGLIGLGSRGFNLLDSLLNSSDVRIVALCDVDAKHYRDRVWGTGRVMGLEPGMAAVQAKSGRNRPAGSTARITATRDFREVCEHPEVDAVVIATPDHWHALCTVTALRAGKDIYCEKPVTHTFYEGQIVSREAARRKAVFQTGSQQRSSVEFQRAVELVRNGHLGKVHNVRVGLPPGYADAQDSIQTDPTPRHLDYDRWCGPAMKLPYMRARHHRWWRGHRCFGGGVLMDWIGHHNDIAHWGLGMDAAGPESVTSSGWSFPDTTVYNTPHHYTLECLYPNGVTSRISSRDPVGTRFEGSEGWVFVTRGKIEASRPEWLTPKFDVGEFRVPVVASHLRNFLDCIKQRTACLAPADTAHRSITPGHLGYVSQTVGRSLRWNAADERIEGDDEADRLLRTHDYREPWQLV